MHVEQAVYEAELHRLRSELILVASGAEDSVETYFQEALQIALQQEARSLELRAAASLAKLMESRGKTSQVSRF